MALEKEYPAHPDLTGGGETDLHSHPGGGNGITTYYAESLADSETTLSGWQTKLSHIVTEAGTFLVQWTFELKGAGVACHCRSQVLHNSTQIGNIQYEPEDINPDFWLGGAGFARRTLAVDDTITIQFCSESGSYAAIIRKAAIFMIKL